MGCKDIFPGTLWEAGRRWVGIESKLLAAIGEALKIPLIRYDAKTETYDVSVKFTGGLKKGCSRYKKYNGVWGSCMKVSYSASDSIMV